MKGIILAGGKGTRLFPATKSISKQLLHVYDKPMIYYPLTTLMNAKIRDILIIVSKNQLENFKNLLGDGSKFGINITYEVQYEANGIPEAFIIGEKFIDNDKVALILGDNIFYGDEFNKSLCSNIMSGGNSVIFLDEVDNPKDFGVAEILNNKVISIEEKPIKPKSSYVVTGFYFYDENVSYYSKSLKKSLRGESEITDLNNIYLNSGKLDYKILDKDTYWCDSGTTESLYLSSEFIRKFYLERGINIGVPEEVAYKNGWISVGDIESSIVNYNDNFYVSYLKSMVYGE